MHKALIIEDDVDFCEEFSEMLRRNGFEVIVENSIDNLHNMIKLNEINILILDQIINHIDLLSVFSDIRKSFSGPIVFLSGNNEEMDRIIALELGAQDFIVKTQSPREISARIRAAARLGYKDSLKTSMEGLNKTYTHNKANISPTSGADSSLWSLNILGRSLSAPEGRVVDLTGSEFEVIQLLSTYPGEVVPRKRFYEKALRRPFLPKDRSLDNMMSRLRNKLDPSNAFAEIIKCTRGVGYSLTISVIVSGVD